MWACFRVRNAESKKGPPQGEPFRSNQWCQGRNRTNRYRRRIYWVCVVRWFCDAPKNAPKTKSAPRSGSNGSFRLSVSLACCRLLSGVAPRPNLAPALAVILPSASPKHHPRWRLAWGISPIVHGVGFRNASTALFRGYRNRSWGCFRSGRSCVKSVRESA